jgi:hypothetical protein
MRPGAGLPDIRRENILGQGLAVGGKDRRHGKGSTTRCSPFFVSFSTPGRLLAAKACDV